jgi:hypothetical protein
MNILFVLFSERWRYFGELEHSRLLNFVKFPGKEEIVSMELQI